MTVTRTTRTKLRRARRRIHRRNVSLAMIHAARARRSTPRSS